MMNRFDGLLTAAMLGIASLSIPAIASAQAAEPPAVANAVSAANGASPGSAGLQLAQADQRKHGRGGQGGRRGGQAAPSGGAAPHRAAPPHRTGPGRSQTQQVAPRRMPHTNAPKMAPRTHRPQTAPRTAAPQQRVTPRTGAPSNARRAPNRRHVTPRIVGPSLSQRAGPRLGARIGRSLHLGGRNVTIVRGRHHASWHGRRYWALPLGVLAGITVGSLLYSPYAYVPVDENYCVGYTADGCRLRWTWVPTEEGDEIPQCVAYCPF